MSVYVGRRINFEFDTIRNLEFCAWDNLDGTYDIYKNRFDGTTPKGVSRSVVLHYIINRGIIS